MAELLTKDRIRIDYERLIHEPGYITTLKKRTSEAKREQILSFARKVNREAITRMERDNGIFHRIYPFRFPPCPLSTSLFILPNGIKLDAFTYKDQLKYWIVTSESVIKTLEAARKINADKIDSLEKACKGKNELTFLRTWFVEQGYFEPGSFVWKKSRKGAKQSLSGYLKDLHKKKYSVNLTDLEIQIIAKNSFGILISIDTIKRASPRKNKIPLPEFKF